MSTTPSQSNSRPKSRSTSHVAFVETIFLSSDDDEDDNDVIIKQSSTKDAIEKNLAEDVQMQDSVQYPPPMRENAEDWEDSSNSSDDDDIIIMDLPPDKTRIFLGSRKSASGPSGSSAASRLPISRPTAVAPTPKKLRAKGRARKSDNLLSFSLPLPKLEIQDDDMKESSQIIPETLDIQLDELHINSSLPNIQGNQSFKITINITESNLNTKQALSSFQRTRTFTHSPRQLSPSSTTKTFSPEKPFILSCPLPNLKRVGMASTIIRYFMEIFVQLSEGISIKRKCCLIYDGTPRFRKLVAISTEDTQGFLFKWRMTTGETSRVGLELALENALRLADDKEKDNIARIFEMQCARDSRDTILIGGFDPSVDLSFTPHRLPSTPTPLSTRHSSFLAPLLLPSTNFTPEDIPVYTHFTPLFSPLPYYRHVTYSTVGYAFDTREQEVFGFPVTRNWHDTEELEGLVERLEDALVMTEIFNNSVNDVDVGAVRRDFAALNVFLDIAGIDEARFDREQAFLEAEKDLHVEKDVEVSTILAMYQKRVGRSAFVVRELAQHAGLTLFKDQKEGAVSKEHYEDFACQFCGLLFCTIHRIDIVAPNVPTLKKGKGKKPARKPCGANCHLKYDEDECMGIEWDETSSSLLESILQRSPEMWSCSLVYELKYTCAQIHKQRSTYSPTPPSSPIIKFSSGMTRSGSNNSIVKPKKRQEVYTTSAYYGYQPCTHPGRCAPCPVDCGPNNCENEGHCTCINNHTPCDKFCGCSSDCPGRFKGCTCSTGAAEVCKTNCPCRKANRECDPELCFCVNKLCINSQIINHDHACVRLARSTLPNAGFGLFASEPIKKFTLIGTYAGEYFESDTPYASFNDAIGEQANNVSYVYNIGQGHLLDSHLHGNFTRYINDNGEENANLLANNSYVNGGLQMSIHAVRDIEEGEELFMSYGEAYFYDHKV